MNNLVIMILSLSISGSILIAILFLCKPLFREHLSKRWQYYIWLIVVARLILPFSLEVNFVGSFFNMIMQRNVATIEETAPSSTTANDDNRGVANSISTDIGVQNDAPYLLTDTFNIEAVTSYSQIDHPTALRSLANQWEGILSYLWLVWLMVALLMFVRKITIYQSFVRYIKAGSVEVSDIESLERLGKIVEQMNIERTVEIYTNKLVSSPLLIGFFRPKIILPTLNINDSDFRYTILHELTHYKRRDMFYKWLVQLTICLHWFNPLVYIMGKEINSLCEFSCDEYVIKSLEHDEMIAYGNALLNAGSVGGAYKNSLSSVTLNENSKIFKKRLDVIVKFKKESKLAIVFAILATLFISTGGAVLEAV